MNIDLTASAIHLAGRFTFAQHDAFQRVVHHLEAGRQPEVRIDLSAVDFIDSAGLGMLLIARDVAREHSVRLVLRGAQGQVAAMLENACFDSLFSLEPGR